MVRQFGLINENGQEYSFMDIEKYCLLTEPSGLGVSYSTEYERVGNSFLENVRTLEQGTIEGTLNFSNYDNYRKLIDFIENSKVLRFHYIVPYKNSAEFYRDVKIQSIGKTEIQPNGFLSESIAFDCLSLWYSIKEANYIIVAGEDEIRWDFRWDSRFISYSSRNLPIVNTGHTDASIKLTIEGEVVNPLITLSVEGEEVQSVPFSCTINENEQFEYSSKDGDSYVRKKNTNGTYTSLFSLDVLQFNNNNVVKLPKGKSCELAITADDEISRATLQVFIYYKSV